MPEQTPQNLALDLARMPPGQQDVFAHQISQTPQGIDALTRTATGVSFLLGHPEFLKEHPDIARTLLQLHPEWKNDPAFVSFATAPAGQQAASKDADAGQASAASGQAAATGAEAISAKITEFVEKANAIATYIENSGLINDWNDETTKIMDRDIESLKKSAFGKTGLGKKMIDSREKLEAAGKYSQHHHPAGWKPDSVRAQSLNQKAALMEQADQTALSTYGDAIALGMNPGDFDQLRGEFRQFYQNRAKMSSLLGHRSSLPSLYGNRPPGVQASYHHPQLGPHKGMDAHAHALAKANAEQQHAHQHPAASTPAGTTPVPKAGALAMAPNVTPVFNPAGFS